MQKRISDYSDCVIMQMLQKSHFTSKALDFSPSYDRMKKFLTTYQKLFIVDTKRKNVEKYSFGVPPLDQ